MIKKAFYIDTTITSEDIENAMRNRSLKRTTSLDMKSSTSYAGTDGKYFLGYEKEKSIDFLRIRSPFEFFLPKILIKFDKENFNKYTLRFDTISTIICMLILLSIVLTLFYSISKNRIESDLDGVLFYVALFVVLTLVEVMINRFYIKKSFTKYRIK